LENLEKIVTFILNYQKAAIVPHTTKTVDIASRIPSYHKHLLWIATFAHTGQTTHRRKPEKDPRKAITVENWGMRMETLTAIRAKATRSTMSIRGRVVVRGDVASTAVVGDTGRDGEGGLAGFSMPSHISRVKLSLPR
jgi:hypothetical protein